MINFARLQIGKPIDQRQRRRWFGSSCISRRAREAKKRRAGSSRYCQSGVGETGGDRDAVEMNTLQIHINHWRIYLPSISDHKCCVNLGFACIIKLLLCDGVFSDCQQKGPIARAMSFFFLEMMFGLIFVAGL